MKLTDPPALPPLRHYFGEARILADWARGRLVEDKLARRWPGDGRPVMVLPGLFTSDARTAMLRRVLNKAGYRAHGWELGRNMPVRSDSLERLDARVSALVRDEGRPVTLIGWSLGGILARAHASAYPDKIAQVITLGSPFSGSPRANRAWQIYELVADHKVDAPPIAHERRGKPPVPVTAIWSARDGIVSASSARGEDDERDAEIEVRCGHFAFTSAPDALEAMLRALAQAKAASGTASER